MHERITANEPENMEAAFNVTGERRKMLVEAIKVYPVSRTIFRGASAKAGCSVV